jgi:hypothetical protein
MIRLKMQVYSYKQYIKMHGIYCNSIVDSRQSIDINIWINKQLSVLILNQTPDYASKE